jgi:hypothetical protein
MLPDIYLNQLILEFEPKALQFSWATLAFLRTFADAENDTERFALFLATVMPSDAPGTLYVANIGNDPGAPDHLRYLLLRPVCEGPLAHQFGRGGQTLALSTFRRSGRIVVSRIEVTGHVPARSFEARVSGPIYWSAAADMYMSREDFEALGGLPFHRAYTRKRLAPWHTYLNWKHDLIIRSQISIPYLAYRWENDTCLAFLVHARDLPARRIENMAFDVAEFEADDLDEDIYADTSGQDRRRARPPKPVRIGEVEKSAPIDRRSAADTRDWADLTVTAGLHRVVIRIDEDEARKLHDRELPERARLLSSVAGELAPLKLQREGVTRLENSSGFCPRLFDFLFDAENAGTPATLLPLEPVESGRTLNACQEEAVRKALSAPDLCLIQGPPGTGKTTVIAEICLRIALAGGRVLVASQTNLAVDNALARLADRPAVRRLRLGNPDKVDEEFKDFLADNVIPRWFGAIADQCRRRLQVAEREQAAHRAREQALAALHRALTRHTGASKRRHDLETAYVDLDRRERLAAGTRDTLRGGLATLERRRVLVESLSTWAAGQGPMPSQIPEDFAFNAISAAQLIMLAASERRHQPMKQLREALDGIHLDAAHTAAGPEVDELRQARARLSGSDNEEELRELLKVNRRLKKLEEDGWLAQTRRLEQATSAALAGERPSCIAALLDAIKPGPTLRAPLQEAIKLAATLVMQADEAQATVRSLHSPLQLLSRSILSEQSDLEEQVKRHERTLADLRTQLDQTRDAGDHAQLDIAESEGQWDHAHRILVPDSPSPPVSAAAAGRATDLLATTQAAVSDRVRHAERWQGIQNSWIERLGDISESDREHLRALYIRHANVLGMTCNEAGKPQFWQDKDFRPFDLVIIDEVSKATPTELILPMLLGTRVVLVGDHRQLSPMFRENESSFSDAIESGALSEDDFKKYRQMVTASLFQELHERAPEAVKATLWTQYRMHPQIMRAVNVFYEDRLEAGPDEQTLGSRRQHHLRIADRDNGGFLDPAQHLLWVDSSNLDGARHEEEQRGSSKVNMLEVRLVIATLEALGRALVERGFCGLRERRLTATDSHLTMRTLVEQLLPGAPSETIDELFSEHRVRLDGRHQQPNAPGRAGALLRVAAQKETGILTFYSAQLREIRRAIDGCRSAAPEVFAGLELRTNTVDRFQGMEKAIIVASLVRASRGNLGSFVREYQRINVGLSRAQQLLVIIGAADTWKRALVPLPPLSGGPPEDSPAYADIFEMVKLSGGRRVARQILA